MVTTKTKAPYRHSDGTDCYTKNCSREHANNLVNAHQSLNQATNMEEFFAAKEKVKIAEKNLTVEQFRHKIMEENPGVKIWLAERENNIVLDVIQISKELRNTGIGTKVMRELTEYADKNQKTISLTPSTDFGSSRARLEVFYRRHGFTTNLGRKRNFEISESMIRFPA